MTIATVAEVTADIAAPHHVVRECWTSARLADWWWATKHDATYDFVPEAGRTYRVSTAGGDGAHGEFLQASDDQLVFTWVWFGPDGEDNGESVTVQLVPVEGEDDVTRIRLVQTANRDTADKAVHWWSERLERLERLFHH